MVFKLDGKACELRGEAWRSLKSQLNLLHISTQFMGLPLELNFDAGGIPD